MISSGSEQSSILNALDRAGAGRVLRRVGLADGPAAPRPADAPEVAALLSDAEFAAQVADLAG